MLTKNAINKLIKSGATDQSTDQQRKRFILNNTAITFFAEKSGQISCLAICPTNMENERDSMTDYFPETFVSSMKHAIEIATR